MKHLVFFFCRGVSLLNLTEVSEGTQASISIYTNTAGHSHNHFTLTWQHNMVSRVLR